MKERFYKRFCNKLAICEKEIVVFLLFGESMLTALNVLVRMIFNQGFSFTEELVVGAFVLSSLIGVALAARKAGDLINMTLLIDSMPKKLALIFDIIAELLLCVLTYMLIVYGIMRVKSLMASGMTSNTMRVPQWYFDIATPIGGVLITLHTIELIVDNIFEIIALGKEKEVTE